MGGESAVIWGILCVLGVPAAIGFGIGWFLRGRQAKRDAAPGGPRDVPVDTQDHVAWLLSELDAGPIRTRLDDDARATLTAYYSPAVSDLVAPSDTDVVAPPTEHVVARDDEAVSAPVVAATFTPANPEQEEPASEELSSLEPVVAGPNLPLPRERTPRERVEWDPAVLMLYLGAFLVVAAGLVYASYNWADLGSWQKLALLGAATLAFAGTGWGLLGNARVRQAAETFVAIGALLVPANAVAAYTVLQETNARTPVIVLLGALVTALVYTVFSLRPGGIIYSYGAVIAGALAVATFPAAFGAPETWGAPVLLVTIALALEVRDRLSERWNHLREPITWTGAILIPLAVLAGAEVTDWLLPTTCAAATLALAQFARRTTHPLPAVAATVVGVGAAIGVVAAVDPEPAWVWSLAILATACALIAVGERGPVWMRRRAVRLALHIEALAGFTIAVIPAGVEGRWPMTGALAVAIAGSALIARLRQSRWWLLATGVFATGCWFSLLGFVDSADWEPRQAVLYAIPLPLILAAVALVLDRWSARKEEDRRAWGEPIWLVSGLNAVSITAFAVAWHIIDEDVLLDLIGWSSVAFALTSLVAAWSLGRALIRIAYALWLLVAIGAIVFALSEDLPAQIPIALALTALVATLSVPAVGNRVGRFNPIFRIPDEDSVSPEAFVFGAAVAALLLGMVAFTFAYVGQPNHRGDDIAAIRWTWLGYLAIYLVATVGSALVGYQGGRRERFLLRRNDRNGARWLPEASLACVGLAALLVLRMATTDVAAWTLVGIGAGVALAAIGSLTSLSLSGNAFTRQFAASSYRAGLGLGALAIASNLSIALASPDQVNLWLEAAVYAVVGLVALGVAVRSGRTFLTYAGFGALAVAVLFVAHARDDSTRGMVLGLVVLAWVVMGTGLALPKTGPWEIHREPWRRSAVAIGVAAFAVVFRNTGSSTTVSTDWQLVTIGLVSLAGLAGVDAWVRQSRLEGTVASGLAMAALEIQIGIGEPANIQFYTVPLGLYVLALGFAHRRDTGTRDILFGMGSAILIVPALILAQTEGRFSYVLLAGGISMALFLAGSFLRFRTPMAAGVVGITIIVLRMLVDAVLALPSWITLLAAGLVLLGGGTLMLTFRETVRAWLDRLRQRWETMG